MIAFAEKLQPVERRVAVHDGYIWPVARAAMRSPEAIVERMAQDIRAFDMPLECLFERDVVAKGWTAAQVAAHGRRAVEIALFGRAA
jgi:hypothetical protein